MGTEEQNLMTLSEVAKYLQVAEKTVLRMVHKNEIPCIKIGSQWRFFPDNIYNWLKSKMKKTELDPITKLIENDIDLVPLSRLTDENFIIMNLKSGSKEDILFQLIEPLVFNGIIEDPETYHAKLMDREEFMSTALDKGVAIPHIRNPEENINSNIHFVIGVCKNGTEFNSLDGKKTKLFFLMFAKSVTSHLRLLGKINKLLMGKKNISDLINAKSKQDVMKILLVND